MSIEEAFTLFEAMRPGLTSLARVLLAGSRVKTSADDLVQTVLLRILVALREGTLRVDAIDNPRAFAYKALRNLHLDEVKAMRNQLERGVADGDPEPPHQGDPDEGRASLLVREILGLFAPHEQRFLIQVVIEERSVQEAQRLCNWPEKAPFYHLKLLLERAREAVT